MASWLITLSLLMSLCYGQLTPTASAAASRPWFVTAYAANGTAGFSGDNSAAIGATMSAPEVGCADGVGGFAVPDQNNHVVRQIFANGTIATIAGVPMSSGYSGEGLPALASKLSSPVSMAPYQGGYVIVCRGTFRIMQLWPNATLVTAAGNGSSGTGGDGGAATMAKIFPQWGVITADPAGSGGGFVWCEQGVWRVINQHFGARSSHSRACCNPWESPRLLQALTPCAA